MLVQSVKEFFRNPALLGVLVLEFVLLFLVNALFTLTGLSLAEKGQNVIVAIFVVFFLVFLLINAWFKSGLAAMIRNVVQDGSTTFREFFPGLKRYGVRFFEVFFVISLVFLIFQAPFVVSRLTSTGSPALLGLALAGNLVLAFFSLWVAPLLVFKDATWLAAFKGSIHLSLERSKTTVKTLFICLFLLLVYFLLSLLINLPYYRALQGVQQLSTNMILVGAVLDVLNAVIFACIFAIAALYIFHTYALIDSAPGRGARQRRSRKRRRAR